MSNISTKKSRQPCVTRATQNTIITPRQLVRSSVFFGTTIKHRPVAARKAHRTHVFHDELRSLPSASAPSSSLFRASFDVLPLHTSTPPVELNGGRFVSLIASVGWAARADSTGMMKVLPPVPCFRPPTAGAPGASSPGLHSI